MANFRVNSDALVQFTKDLYKASPAAFDALKKSLQYQGAQILEGKARETASWSKKIPRTFRTNVVGKAPVRLRLYAGYKGTPIAVWYQLGHTQGHAGWRHPVWPGRKPRSKWTWVEQAKGDHHRPYLTQALQQSKKQVAQAVLNALVNSILQSVPYFKRV